jgi:AcrR family transcriptional regulator
MPTATRQSAEQRRETVLAAAIEEFARGGLGGTSTQTIAERAGISQPYLFRLYPTKKDLFLAAVERTHRRIVEQFEAAVGDRSGEDALKAMGAAYGELIADRTFLLMELASYAACDDEDVRAVSRRGFRDVWYAVERLSGASPEEVQKFYAFGMFWNVVTAMQLDEVHERWAELACVFSDKVVPPATPPT